MKGNFVMVDGMDGAGKGVIVDALKEWALNNNLKVIDLREWWKHNQGYPEVEDYDVVVSAEPTFTGMGKKIREEMIKDNGRDYSPEEIANAFAEDRRELYDKVIIPAIAKGKIVFQERGIVTSLVYQQLQGIEKQKILELEGNIIAMQHPPSLLILVTADPEVVIDRLGLREKQDGAIFEKLEFQKKAKTGFESEWLKELFEKHNTRVAYLNTDPPKTIEDTKNHAIEIWEKL